MASSFFRSFAAKIKTALLQRRNKNQSAAAISPPQQQVQQQVQQQQQPPPPLAPVAATMTPSLSVDLVNKTTSSNVVAYVTGTDPTGKLFLLQADGASLYNPPSPAASNAGPTPLTEAVAIPLGAPGATKSLTIPTYIAGGRIWFAVNGTLSFFVNPGPALVSPSINNPSDPNIQVLWGFAELSFNEQQVFANISYVDFVSLPIGMSLTTQSGPTQSVPGLPADGLAQVAAKLTQQAAADSQPWDKLIVRDAAGAPLRVLSPNSYLAVDSTAWSAYWTPYVTQVWARYAGADLTINTQAAAGSIAGRVNASTHLLQFPGDNGAFAAPTAADIFSCNSGPFAPGQSAGAMAVVPRLAAAFNRSTLLLDDGGAEQPNGVTDPSRFYSVSPTNHYARAVHEVETDGRGYAFAYDDVVGDGGKDVAGTVFDGAPKVLTVTVGG